MTTAPIPIPGRASVTSWRTSSTYTSSYFDDDNDSTTTSLTETDTNSIKYSSTLTKYSAPRNNTHTDSGYATGNVSLEVKDNTGNTRFQSINENSQIKIKSTPLPGREDLQVFRKDIDASFTARYREIMPELHRLLQRQLSTQQTVALPGRRLFHSSRGAKSRTNAAVQMSMRLMTVGKTVQDAKPAIIIFTQGEQTSGLERLLRQPLMQQLYQPDDDRITPSFEVIVVGEPARKRGCTTNNISAVFNDAVGSGRRDSSTVTYCGARILLEAGGTQSVVAVATLGGLVKLTFAVGDFMLVGMTAGHVLEDLYLDDDESEDVEVAGLEEKDDSNQGDQQTFQFQPQRKLMGELLYPLTEPTEQDNEDYLPQIPPRDWALFEMNPSLKLKPNLIPRETDAGTYRHLHHHQSFFDREFHPRSLSHGGQDISMTTAVPSSFPCMEPTEVVMIASNNTTNTNKSSPIFYGELSHIPASIILNSTPQDDEDSDNGIVQAYILTLDEKKDQTTPTSTSTIGLPTENADLCTLGQIQDGHSGAWVVNPVSMEVYGHVVATDFTGDAYVIPLHATFDEIKSSIPGVEGVELPCLGDLLDVALRKRRARGAGDVHGVRENMNRRRSTRDTDTDMEDTDTNAHDSNKELVKRGGGTVDKTGGKDRAQDGQRESGGYKGDRDRRTSELLSLTEWRDQQQSLEPNLNWPADSDLDSGYGSVDASAMKVMFSSSDDSDKENERSAVALGADISSCRPMPGRERRRRQSFWLDSDESLFVSVW